MRKLRNIFQKFGRKSCVPLMLRELRSKPHKTYQISQKYTGFFFGKKYVYWRKKLLREEKVARVARFSPQHFLPTTFSSCNNFCQKRNLFHIKFETLRRLKYQNSKILNHFQKYLFGFHFCKKFLNCGYIELWLLI